MVIVAGIAQFINGGFYLMGLSVYFLPITRDLNLSRTALSVAFTLRSLEGGLESPIVGYLIDRLGPRFMFRAGMTMGGIGFILLAFTHDYVSFLFVFLGVLALGFAGGVVLPLSTLMNHWFSRQRAFAVTIAQVGSEVGGTLLTPFVAYLVLNVGWRQAAIFSGIVYLFSMPFLSHFMRNTPESMGLGPDGDPPRHRIEPVSHASGAHGGAIRTRDDGDFTVREALSTKAFWHLTVAVGVRMFSKSSLMVHLVPLLVWKGFDEQTAALLVGLFALVQIPLRIGAGHVADRWSMTRVPALSTLAGAGSIAVLLMGGQSSLAVGALFVILFALAETGNSPAWALIGHFFGRANFASIRGSLNFFHSLISLPAPIVAGWLFDTTGSYQLALLPIGCFYVLAFMLFWVLQPPRKRTTAPAATGS